MRHSQYAALRLPCAITGQLHVRTLAASSWPRESSTPQDDSAAAVSSHTTDEIGDTAVAAGRTDSSPTTTSDGASLDFALTPLLPSTDEQYGRYKSVEAPAAERVWSAPLLAPQMQSSALVPLEESLEDAIVLDV